eukprot:359139-Chlamydomonas_euryale.AAC.12
MGVGSHPCWIGVSQALVWGHTHDELPGSDNFKFCLVNGGGTLCLCLLRTRGWSMLTPPTRGMGFSRAFGMTAHDPAGAGAAALSAEGLQ